MSGGHFNYNQFMIGRMADDIEWLIGSNDSKDVDDFGCRVGMGYSTEVVGKFREAVIVLRRAETMAHRIDWLVSGDDGEDSFLRRLEKDLSKLQSA